MWHIIWNGFLIITPTDNKIRGPSCCDYAFHKFGLKKGHFNMNKCSICWYEFHSQMVYITLILQMTALLLAQVRSDQWEHLTPSWRNSLNKTLLVSWLGFVIKKKHLSVESRCAVFYEQKAWTVTSFLNDYWQIPCLPAVHFLFTTAQSRDSLAQGAVRVVNREPYCHTIRLVLYEMNQRLGDQ